jgi:hypothetical protein
MGSGNYNEVFSLAPPLHGKEGQSVNLGIPLLFHLISHLLVLLSFSKVYVLSALVPLDKTPIIILSLIHLPLTTVFPLNSTTKGKILFQSSFLNSSQYIILQRSLNF